MLFNRRLCRKDCTLFCQTEIKSRRTNLNFFPWIWNVYIEVIISLNILLNIYTRIRRENKPQQQQQKGTQQTQKGLNTFGGGAGQGEERLKSLPHSLDKILAKVLQLPLWCVWFWLLPFTGGTELDRCSWCLELRATVKRSAQSQCTREIFELENLSLIVLNGEITKDDFQ